MSPSARTQHGTQCSSRTRRVARASGSLAAAAAVVMVGFTAHPATAMPDPPPPSPDPWQCVDLHRSDPFESTVAQPVNVRDDGATEAAAALGVIGGITLTGGGVALIALGRRRSRIGQPPTASPHGPAPAV